MSGNTKVALFLGSIIIFPTIFIISIIYGLNYANDPKNVVCYATEKWGDIMKQGVIDNDEWDGKSKLTRFEYDENIKPPKNARFILYSLGKQKFRMLDGDGIGADKYIARNPEDVSIIVVYGIRTKIVGQIVTTSSRGNTYYKDAEADYVKIELIDVSTWKVFAAHTSIPGGASVKNPKVVEHGPTRGQFEFINQILDSLQGEENETIVE